EHDHRRSEGLDLAPQLLEALVGAGEAPEPRRGLIQEPEHLRIPRAVLPLEALELPDPLSDRCQPGRVQRERLTVRAEVMTELGRLSGDGLSSDGQTRCV